MRDFEYEIVPESIFPSRYKIRYWRFVRRELGMVADDGALHEAQI